MADTRTKEERSKNMAAIKSKDTKPEVYLRKLLFKHGFRYRKHSKTVPGHPDMWMKKYNTAIFINGCFWHRHQGCKYAYEPKSRTDYWLHKFESNIQRDAHIYKELQSSNHKCLVIWECSLKKIRRDVKTEEHLIETIREFLNSEESYKEI